MLAVLDEAMPEDSGGIYYVIASAVIIEDQDAARKAARDVIANPKRTRPFHWAEEGSTARDAITTLLESNGCVAHLCVHYPTGRKKQVAARERSLRNLVPKLLLEGVDELIIEQRRTFNDLQDRVIIDDVLAIEGAVGRLTVDWYPKAEPLLWYADALCGATGAYLLNADTTYFERLRDASVIDEIGYLSESVP